MQVVLFGVPVVIERSALVLAGIYVLFGLQRAEPALQIAVGILAIFGSIFWHELGHALVATAFKLGPISITMHGFGGLTRFRPPDKHWKELIISLAGPIFGLTLGFGVLGGVMLFGAPQSDIAIEVVERLLFVNIVWSLFNLLPLYPLDGGQALAAFLRIVAPAIALTVVVWIGLIGGLSLGIGAIALSWLGYGSAIFMLFIAGTVVSNNWALRSAIADSNRQLAQRRGSR